MKIESLRSPYQKVGGLYHFARMLDKIRLHQAGKLPAEHHPNFGLSVGLDGHLCSFLGVEFAAVCERVRQGGTDDEIAEWCFQHGLRPNKMQTRIWNEFARPGARVARLHRGHRVAQPHGLHQLPRGGFGISPAQVGARAGLSPEKNFWAFTGNRIAVRFEYEFHDASGQWFRAHGSARQRELGVRRPRLHEIPLRQYQRSADCGDRAEISLGAEALVHLTEQHGRHQVESDVCLTIHARRQGLVNLTITIDGKMRGDSIKVIVLESIGNVLNGLGKNRT